MKNEYLTESSLQTKKTAQSLARKFLKRRPRRKALVLALKGDLGGGKTTFLQGFAKGLRIKEKILSPTFIIMKQFTIYNLQFTNFYHIDCYRIENPKELLNLGFKEIVSNPENIVAIEWADRVNKIIPKKAIWINFKFVDKNKRKIIIRVNSKS